MMVSVLVVPNVVWSFRRGRPRERASTQNKRMKVQGVAVDGGVYPRLGGFLCVVGRWGFFSLNQEINSQYFAGRDYWWHTTTTTNLTRELGAMAREFVV
jgi:hypothetical protein